MEKLKKVCKCCGVPIPKSKGNRERIYCSVSCQRKSWHLNNRGATLKRQRDDYLKHSEKIKARHKKYRAENHEKIKHYRENNKDKINKLKGVIEKKDREQLKDRYIIRLILGTGSLLKANDIPKLIIEAKRAQLLVLRATK